MGQPNVRMRRLPVLKGAFCVSTVSIVCGRAPGSMAVVSGCTYWTGRRLARPRIVIVIADDADGTDGIFWPRTDFDHSGSSIGLHDRRRCGCPVPEGMSAHDASGPATARGFLGQPLAPLEAAANSSAGLPFDASQLTFISMSSQVTRVRGPSAGSCCIEGPNPRFAPR